MSPVMVELFFCDTLTAMAQDGNANKTFFCWSFHYSQCVCQMLQIPSDLEGHYKQGRRDGPANW